jgi:hypothetical protein
MLVEVAGVTRRLEAPEEDRRVRGQWRVLLAAEGAGDEARRRREGRRVSETDVMRKSGVRRDGNGEQQTPMVTTR